MLRARTSGLVGLRSSFGKLFVVDPQVDSSISYFALDGVAYHSHNISIAFDMDGKRYAERGCSNRLCVWVDGKIVAHSAMLKRLSVTL